MKGQDNRKSVSYTHLDVYKRQAFWGSEQEKEAPFSRSAPKWRLFLKISDNLYVFSKQRNGQTIYSPLAIHSFLFLRPKKLTDAEKFNIQYPNPAMLTTTADKLRYYRYKKSLLQREVADYAGINESTYIHYENPEHDYYPIDKLGRIAELLEVNVTDLLDEYNRFLYDGQGWQIRKIRKSMGLTQYQFGKLYGVSAGAVKQWESGKVRVTKGTWERVLELNFQKISGIIR